MDTTYERTLGFNSITRFLHTTRYKNLRTVCQLPELRGPIKVVDIGCGTAKSFEVISEVRSDFDYVGIEPLEEFCRVVSERHGHKANFKIVQGFVQDHWDILQDADLIIGLESFEHIPEPIVVRLCERIAACNFKVLYVTVPNEVGPAILVKNVGSWLMGYVRHKEYTWAETFSAAIYRLDDVTRHGTGHIGFDWRWLAATLRQNVRITGYTCSPSQLVPRFLSPSIGFLCRPTAGADRS
ncbi:class I SAM-dependent methyltransferase [Tabrizicola sp. M-4]|uniref:class I SAM-dependent methyltransferase n=1 Tax=Tabrizicola sp. M-4 TaxID=3055847 RepID=UPI003DA9C02F